MKAQLRPSDLSTPCPRRNLRLCISSLTRTLPQGSSDLPGPPMEPWSSLFGKKTALFDFALTSEASTESPRKTNIHFLFQPLRHTMKSMDLYQNRSSENIPSVSAPPQS